jgi:hypothetical protein
VVGAANVCASGTCTDGACEVPAPVGNCGTFKATTWNGAVSETDTANCGGIAGLSLDAGLESILHLTPSPTVEGGCVVDGTVNLVQSGGPICGAWGGPWTCGGTVSAGGSLSVTCSCFTTMTVIGSRQGGGYAGSWDFSATGQDGGAPVTNEGVGSFVLNRVP